MEKLKFKAPIIQTVIVLLIALIISIGSIIIVSKFIKVEHASDKILVEFDRDDLWDIIEMQNKNIREYRTEEPESKLVDLDSIENEALSQVIMNLEDNGFLVIGVYETSHGNFEIEVKPLKEFYE